MDKILISPDGDIIAGSVRLRASYLAAIARRIAPESAQDVVQEIYLDILHRPPEKAQWTPARLKVRCYRAGLCAARKMYTWKRRCGHDLDDDYRDDGDTPEAALLISERRREVRERVETISRDAALRVARALMRGASKSEAARMLGVSPQAITRQVKVLEEFLGAVA